MNQYDLDKQHQKGKLHAIERIHLIMDEGSFTETYIGPGSINAAGSAAYDGVITGFGKIKRKKVYIYSQDFTVKGGTIGLNQGFKIARTIEDAITNKCPIIGISDSGGARIQDGIDAMAGYGEVFYYNTLASGYIPQIAIIAGPCAGGAVYSPAIMDFTFIVDHIGKMFLTGPKVIKQVTNVDVSVEELGGSTMHAQKSGVAHFRCQSEIDCYNQVRDLITLIPSCYAKKKLEIMDFATLNIQDKDQTLLQDILPSHDNMVYSMRELVKIIVDENTYFGVLSEYAKNILTAFAKIGDITVGIVANEPKYRAGVLDCDASDKAARFIRFCDNFNIPIITFTDVPGFMPGIDEERKGIIRHGAKLLYAYSEATTIKINVIIRKAYGGSYVAMCSKHLRADRVYAWPSAKIAVMGAEAACEVIYAKTLNTFTDEAKKKIFFNEKVEEYRKTAMGIDIANQRGYVDKIIDPVDTRNRLITDLRELINKTRNRKMTINKKHGNIPL